MAFSLISGMIPFIAMLLFPAKQLVNKHHLKTHRHHEFEGSIPDISSSLGPSKPDHLESMLCLLLHILSTQHLRISYPSDPISYPSDIFRTCMSHILEFNL